MVNTREILDQLTLYMDCNQISNEKKKTQEICMKALGSDRNNFQDFPLFSKKFEAYSKPSMFFTEIDNKELR